MASTAPLRLHLVLSPAPHRPPSRIARFHKTHHTNPNPLRRLSPISASQSLSSWESEESRWLREEQRWLREEQRWLREESRWNSERESLLCEIATLREKLEAIERGSSSIAGADKRIASVEVLLRALKEQAVAPPPAVLVEEAQVKEMILEGSVHEGAGEGVEVAMNTLRKGSEGEDVRVMQEALERLGFYSGEEDIEYHMFSNGTQRAVKTWQASLGVLEDGIMTPELLKRLFAQPLGGATLEVKLDKRGKDGSSNGAPFASVTGITEAQQSVIKDTANKEVEASPHRVFLLGENRWEEPSRLVSKDKLPSRSRDVSLVKCLSCHGEGHLICTECDGTGEPNIEPQFLEWVDEGTKCPYCEGLGYTICDVCEGKTLVENQQSREH